MVTGRRHEAACQAHDGAVSIESCGDPSTITDAPHDPPPIEVLQRWQAFGATWRVVSQTSSGVTLALCRCDGGEEVERLSSADPELIDWLARRHSSEQ
jgi:hypothetical protein